MNQIPVLFLRKVNAELVQFDVQDRLRKFLSISKRFPQLVVNFKVHVAHHRKYVRVLLARIDQLH